MNKFTYAQKVSIMRILMDLVLADGRIDERETMFFDRIAELLGLDIKARKDVDTKNIHVAPMFKDKVDLGRWINF